MTNNAPNLFFTGGANPGEVAYYTASVGVVYDRANDTQRHFRGHTKVGWCKLKPVLTAPDYCYAVLSGGTNGDGAWRGMVTIVESIDPRPYNSVTRISEADLLYNSYERPSMNSSKPKSPFAPPTKTA